MIPLHFICVAALAIDGDTLSCHRPDGSHYLARLAAIDAPEFPGHCRKGRDCAPGDPFLAQLELGNYAVIGQDIPCDVVDANPFRKGFQPLDPYGRPVVRCQVDGRDLSDAMLASGLVRPWP